jgi:hypothetical protein
MYLLKAGLISIPSSASRFPAEGKVTGRPDKIHHHHHHHHHSRATGRRQNDKVTNLWRKL